MRLYQLRPNSTLVDFLSGEVIKMPDATLLFSTGIHFVWAEVNIQKTATTLTRSESGSVQVTTVEDTNAIELARASDGAVSVEAAQ